jgi:hypothetical protein
MNTVDHMHEQTEAFSADDMDTCWKVFFVRSITVFRQSRWAGNSNLRYVRFVAFRNFHFLELMEIKNGKISDSIPTGRIKE